MQSAATQCFDWIRIFLQNHFDCNRRLRIFEQCTCKLVVPWLTYSKRIILHLNFEHVFLFPFHCSEFRGDCKRMTIQTHENNWIRKELKRKRANKQIMSYIKLHKYTHNWAAAAVLSLDLKVFQNVSIIFQLLICYFCLCCFCIQLKEPVSGLNIWKSSIAKGKQSANKRQKDRTALGLYQHISQKNWTISHTTQRLDTSAFYLAMP